MSMVPSYTEIKKSKTGLPRSSRAESAIPNKVHASINPEILKKTKKKKKHADV